MTTKKLIIIFGLAALVNTSLWILSKSNPTTIFLNPWRSLAQITALIGFTYISLNILLSSKFIFLDKIFRGLDRVMNTHKTLGNIAFILILLHPLFLIASDLPNISLARTYLLPGNDLAYTLGISGLYLFFFSFLFIVFIKLPYHIWKLSHQLLGLAFLLGGFHSTQIGSDISRFLPLQTWTLLAFTAGVSTAIYNIFFYSHFGPRHFFIVEKTQKLLDIINIYLKPVQNNLNFSPGQFIYVSFDDPEIGRERHPFTISSAPGEPLLRLSAKILGDYTARLPKIQKQTKATLHGPYGSFGQKLYSEDSQQIWIAGGIGVTPFLSFVRAQKEKPLKKDVHFYYLFTNPEEGVFSQEITEAIKHSPNIHFTTWCSKEKGRFQVNNLSHLIKNTHTTSVYLCGPVPMMKSLTQQFVSLGISEEKIYSEVFALD